MYPTHRRAGHLHDGTGERGTELRKSSRSSSLVGFSSTLSMPTSATRASMSGEDDAVISRIGRSAPLVRNLSASSRPDMYGI
jgi:hypothetical protein